MYSSFGADDTEREMAREAKNTVAANDLAVAKVIKRKVAKQSEWKVLGVPGLSIVVSPTGVASYQVRCMAGNGARRKQVRRAIGHANGPLAIKLSKARADAIALVGAAKGTKDEATDKTTLRQLFDQFVENNQGRSLRTVSDYRGALERDVFDELGHVPVVEITAKDIARVLMRVEKRSRNSAHKCRAALGSLYKWAKHRLLVDENPMLGMGFVHTNERRKLTFGDGELATLWTAIDGEEFASTDPMRLVLKLAILTGQRNSEVCGARKTELHLSVANPRWVIPGERMTRKNQEQVVYLSTQAAELFARAIELSGDKTFVFPGSAHGRRKGEWRQPHVAQESVSKAMAALCKVAGVEDVHLHDMRKAITSWLFQRGERPDIIDRILHHGSKNVTETHYNFASMDKWLRDAWQAWADHVVQIASQGASGAKVVALKRA
jgi:integrase